MVYVSIHLSINIYVHCVSSQPKVKLKEKQDSISQATSTARMQAYDLVSASKALPTQIFIQRQTTEGNRLSSGQHEKEQRKSVSKLM